MQAGLISPYLNKISKGTVTSYFEEIPLAFCFFDWWKLNHEEFKIFLQDKLAFELAGNPNLIPFAIYCRPGLIEFEKLDSEDLNEQIEIFWEAASGYLLYHQQNGTIHLHGYGQIADSINDFSLQSKEEALLQVN